MKPHRRKDTPPRRESGSDHNNAGTPDDSESEYTGHDEMEDHGQEDIIYDPGAALVDENQQYGDPGYGNAEPEQAFVDPGDAYADPNAGYEQQENEYSGSDQSGYQPPPPAFTTGGVYDEAPPYTQEVPAPPPLRTPKKKVAHRAPQRRPAIPGRNTPGSRYSRPRPSYSGGGVSIMTVFLTLVALGMLGVVAMVVIPRDMAAVAGYPANPLVTGKPRNLLDEAQKIMIQRTGEIAFTEEEVNQYLNHRLQAEQTGPMAALVKFRGVYVDFSAGLAEVVIERELFGRPLTMSAKIKTEEFRRQTVYRASGWTLGSIDLGSRNIKPVIELFLRLRNTCLDEYQTIQQMVDVRFEENRLVLDSRM